MTVGTPTNRRIEGAQSSPSVGSLLVASSASPYSGGVNQANSSNDALGELYNRLNTIQPMIPDRLSIACLEAAGVPLSGCAPPLSSNSGQNGPTNSTSRLGVQAPSANSQSFVTGAAGQKCDARLARLVSLGAQQFLTDVLGDALAHWKLTNSGATGGATVGGTTTGGTEATETPVTAASGANSLLTAALQSPTKPTVGLRTGTGANANQLNQASGASNTATASATGGAVTSSVPERRPTLTMDCLVAALRDRGINVARPVFYR